MGAYLFLVVCCGLWCVFGWTLLARPAQLDRAWQTVRALPLVAKPVVWLALLPWLSGLAIWESGWRTPTARGVAVLLVAAAFIAFWLSVTFAPNGA
jgi:hypothetical protein